MLGLDDMQPVYMDYAATTPVADEVVTEMQRALADFGNPSSDHAWGLAASAHVDLAARRLADALGIGPESIVWTSGATESDNLAIIGGARYRAARGRHVVTCRTEHKAVIDACKQLEREGFEVTWLSPDDDGRVSPAALADALRDDTVLVSLMWVNNEIGTINDIVGLAKVMADHDALFHVDAAQAFGKLSIRPGEHAIDLMSVTAHKCYGPMGLGFLVSTPAGGARARCPCTRSRVSAKRPSSSRRVSNRTTRASPISADASPSDYWPWPTSCSTAPRRTVSEAL